MSSSVVAGTAGATTVPRELPIRTLIRHNRSIREWRLLLLAAGHVGVTGGMRMWRLSVLEASGTTPAAQDLLSNLILAGLYWLPVCMLVVFALRRPRYPELLLSLPVSARRLWSSHVLGLLLAGGASLILASLLMTFLDSRWSASHAGTIPGSPLRSLPAALAMLLITVTAITGTAPDLTRLPATRRRNLVSTAGLIAWLPATMLLITLPPVVALLVAVLAAGLLVQVGRGLEPTLSVSPVRLESGPEARPATWSVDRAPRGRAFNRGLLKILFGDPKAWMLLALLVFYGLLLSGLLDAMSEDGDTRINYIPLTWYLLVIASQTLLRRIRVLDALPVPRTRLAALVAGVPLALAALGFAAGGIATRIALPAPTAITYSEAEEGNAVRVLPEYFAISRNGESPLIEAPWGETVKPRTYRILPLVDAVLYNPWATDATSSPRFVAWQLARAAKALLDRDLDPLEIEARALTVDDEGHTAPREPARPVLAEFGSTTIRSASPLAAVFALIVIGPTLLMLIPILRSQRASVPETKRRWILWGTLGGVFALWIPFFVMFVRFDFSFWTLTAVLRIGATRAAAHLPGGEIALGLIVLAILIPVYHLYQRAFLRMEYVPVNTGGDCS